MANLAKYLQSVTRGDGTADIRKRVEELENLVWELSPSEIRVLQELLSSFRFVRDFIPELPEELLILILDYLELSDVEVVWNVSRKWEYCWSQIAICNRVMVKYFRSVYEMSYVQLPDKLKPQYFRGTLQRALAQQKGEYCTMRIMRYHDKIPEYNECQNTWRYRFNNGRVSWISQNGLTLSNLLTGSVKLYVMPERDGIWDWKLSEKFLIVATGQRQKLYAWDLESDEIFSIRLPNIITRISTGGDRVGIVMSEGDPLIWIVGGALRQLETIDSLAEHHEGSYCESIVIFHPSLIDTTFVLSCFDIQPAENIEVPRNIRWIVQKYVDWRLNAVSKMMFSFVGSKYGGIDTPFHLELGNIDENGSYGLCSILVEQSSQKGMDLYCQHRQYWSGNSIQNLAVHFTFNVYAERVSWKSFHLPVGACEFGCHRIEIPSRGLDMDSHALCWSGQRLSPTTIFSLKPEEPPDCCFPAKKTLITALKPCDRICKEQASISYNGGYEPGNLVRWLTPAARCTHNIGLVYCLVEGPDVPQLFPYPDETRTSQINPSLAIQGDGNFVVLFREKDYVVWCYDKEISYPFQVRDP